MSSDSSSPAPLTEHDVLTVLPITGLAVNTALVAASQPPTAASERSSNSFGTRPRTALIAPHTTPLAKSFSAVLSDIDALPSPLTSINAATSDSFSCASPLTERALRYRRRDALRAARDVVVPTSSPGPLNSNVLQNSTVPAKTFESHRSDIVATPQPNTPVANSLRDYGMAATLPRVIRDDVLTASLQRPLSLGPPYPPFSAGPLCPLPSAPLRAFDSMSSPTPSRAITTATAASAPSVPVLTSRHWFPPCHIKLWDHPHPRTTPRFSYTVEQHGNRRLGTPPPPSAIPVRHVGHSPPGHEGRAAPGFRPRRGGQRGRSKVPR